MADGFRQRAAPTIIVPVYNEGVNLAAWWDEARAHLPAESRVRVVYDFDGGDTLPVARELKDAGAPIETLRNRGRGVLDALVTGLRSVSSGPVIVSMADLSDDLGVIPVMLTRYREGADVVVASRFMPGGTQERGPLLKGFLARWGSLALYHLAGFPVRDASNSFRLYDAALLSKIDFKSTGGFEIGFEITLEAWRRGARIVEVPSRWRDRVRGRSRFRLMKWLPRYGRLWWSALVFGLGGPDRG